MALLNSGQLHQGTIPGFRLDAAPTGVAVGGAAVRHRERPQHIRRVRAALA